MNESLKFKKYILAFIVFVSVLLFSCFTFMFLNPEQNVCANIAKQKADFVGPIYKVIHCTDGCIPDSGDGTQTNPYKICCKDTFYQFVGKLMLDSLDNYKGMYFELVNDLNFGRGEINPSIGYALYDEYFSSHVSDFIWRYFQGVEFNGNGHTIANYTMTTTKGVDYNEKIYEHGKDDDWIYTNGQGVSDDSMAGRDWKGFSFGFFTQIDKGTTIKNLRLANVTWKVENYYLNYKNFNRNLNIGGIVGNLNGGKIENCEVDGLIIDVDKPDFINADYSDYKVFTMLTVGGIAGGASAYYSLELNEDGGEIPESFYVKDPKNDRFVIENCMVKNIVGTAHFVSKIGPAMASVSYYPYYTFEDYAFQFNPGEYGKISNCLYVNEGELSISKENEEGDSEQIPTSLTIIYDTTTDLSIATGLGRDFKVDFDKHFVVALLFMADLEMWLFQ